MRPAAKLKEQEFGTLAQKPPERMKGTGAAGFAILLIAALAGSPRAVAAPASTPATWAVLIESNWYHGRYADLPVGYINSARMLAALSRRGSPSDHIFLIRDSSDRAVLHHATDWLAARVRPGDVAVLYIAGEYQFFDKDLAWSATFPGWWRRIPTAHRVLIVETCFAERLTTALRGSPGLGLPAVGRDERDWWGLRETGSVIRGGSFTYFLAHALEWQAVDAPLDFSVAFATAVASAQEYFHNVIATTPGALNPFHATGDFPERLATFPNPHLIEEIDAQPAPVDAAHDP